MVSSSVKQLSGRQLVVVGAIGFDNVLQLRQQGERLIDAADERCEIDFSEVSRTGSAGLTLLFCWLRYAGDRQKTLTYSNLPEDLVGLARVGGVDELLPIKK